MNTTLQFSQLAAATLASAALALGIDWVLLCAAFRLMSSAPSQWRANRLAAPVAVTAPPREGTARRRAA